MDILVAPDRDAAGMLARQRAFPDATRVACFDTAFHRHRPFVNDAFALPRRFYAKGMRRNGFHRLSHDFIAGGLPMGARCGQPDPGVLL